MPRRKKTVIVKANEAGIALPLIRQLLRGDKKGVGVIISDAPEGQVPHCVFGPWGTDYGGHHYRFMPKGRMNAGDDEKINRAQPPADAVVPQMDRA